jgi:hypothetical protein
MPKQQATTTRRIPKAKTPETVATRRAAKAAAQVETTPKKPRTRHIGGIAVSAATKPRRATRSIQDLSDGVTEASPTSDRDTVRDPMDLGKQMQLLADAATPKTFGIKASAVNTTSIVRASHASSGISIAIQALGEQTQRRAELLVELEKRLTPVLAAHERTLQDSIPANENRSSLHQNIDAELIAASRDNETLTRLINMLSI